MGAGEGHLDPGHCVKENTTAADPLWSGSESVCVCLCVVCLPEVVAK